MATNEHSTSRRALILGLAGVPFLAGTMADATTPGEPTPDGMALYEEAHKEGHTDATSAFAVAWLANWRSLGNSFGTVHKKGEAPEVWFGVDMLLDALPLRTDLEPHLGIYSREHHEGATRALEALLGSVPGGREAVLTLVQQGA